MLKMTKFNLELIPDSDSYLLFQKGMKWGVSYISNRYSKVNGKYLKSYDPNQESKRIIYLDANNLYLNEMFKFLLTRRFKTVDPKEFELNKYTRNSSKGCAL